jgi:hypothetical protein
VKVDDENTLAGTVLRSLQKIDDRCKPRAARERGRDVVQAHLVNAVDQDGAVAERVAAAHLDVRALPDADGAADLSGAYAFVKACLEQHGRAAPVRCSRDDVIVAISALMLILDRVVAATFR